MKSISIERITIDGYRSYRTPVTLELCRDEGLIFLGGINLSEPELGGNGTGKSSLFGALFWCLTGTDLRGLRVSDLRSWERKAPTRVSCDFKINDVPCNITRKGPPNQLFLDEQQVNQEDIDKLLGRNAVQLRHSVIFGQAEPLFIDLPVPKRADLLDETMKLGYWMWLSEQCGKESKKNNCEIDGILQAAARLEGQVAALSDISELQKRSDLWERNYNEEVNSALQAVGEAEMNLTRASENLKTVRLRIPQGFAATVSRIEEINAKLVEIYVAIRQEDVAIMQLQQKSWFYKNTQTCPTCHQAIVPSFIAEEKDRIEKEIADRECLKQAATKKREQYESEIAVEKELELALREKRDAYRKDLTVAECRYTEAQHGLVNRETQAEKLIDRGNINPFEQRIENMKRQRQQLEVEIKELQTKREQIKRDTELLEFWQSGFKRLRLFYIKRIISVLELEVNSAASILGLHNWRISVKVETENKSGTTKHGVQVVIASSEATAVWEAWSGGESQRLRLAVSVGLANLIERATGTRYALEVWDEPSSWLSAEGIESLMEMLEYRALTTHKSVYVADHRAIGYGGFSQIINAIKDKKGTRLECVD